MLPTVATDAPSSTSALPPTTTPLSQLSSSPGFGLIGDLIIGVIGAFIGSWLLPQLGIHIGSGIVSAIVSATIGAVLLLIILRIFRRRGRW